MWTDGWIKVPEHTKDAIDRYVNQGLKPGGFVQAVLQNDLSLAAQRADWTNIHYIRDIIIYCCTYIPAYMWGGARSYEDHLNKEMYQEAEFREELNRLKKTKSHKQELLPFKGFR